MGAKFLRVSSVSLITPIFTLGLLMLIIPGLHWNDHWKEFLKNCRLF